MNANLPNTKRDEVKRTAGFVTAGGGRFVAHEVALEAAGVVVELLREVSGPYGDLVRQARRAVVSVPLNLAEGRGRAGRDRVQHYRIAYGSAREAVSAVRLLVAVRGIDGRAGERALELLDRACALTWKLIQNPGLGR